MEALEEPAADWSRCAAIYAQCIHAAADQGHYLPNEIPAFLAELLSRNSTQYYDAWGHYVRDAKLYLDSDTPLHELYFDARFEELPIYNPPKGSGRRRRPTPFEAIVETCRRLRDIDRVAKTLNPSSVAGLLGGSGSYGRFFNIVGQREPGSGSDIDFLVIVEDNSSLSNAVESLSEIEYASRAAINAAYARIGEFLDYQSKNAGLGVFSCKVPLWGATQDPYLTDISVDGDYHLSLHIVTRSVFDAITFRHTKSIDRELTGDEQLMADFREARATRSDHQRSFGGTNARFAIESSEFGSSFVRQTRVFSIDESDYFFPGMLQNLILPAFDLCWGPLEVQLQVEAFRWKMVERLRFERRKRPDEMLRLSFSHTRSEVFSPHVVRNVDASTHLS